MTDDCHCCVPGSEENFVSEQKVRRLREPIERGTTPVSLKDMGYIEGGSFAMGSEMCIRDSHCCVPGSEENFVSEQKVRRLREPIERGTTPVSYTHLTLPTILLV